MVARLLTFFIAAAIVVAMVTIIAPSMLNYVWAVLCICLIAAIGYIIYIYLRKTLRMIKEK